MSLRRPLEKHLQAKAARVKAGKKMLVDTKDQIRAFGGGGGGGGGDGDGDGSGCSSRVVPDQYV